ncbi:hypothetical protein CEE44_05020 [Candidatus Woesearchaeota archaeon B3_Woes]|nr:MAG: hypothetical protein CEE44_05020 [Candidatus Woesearchaeota archaeon B3_Woes]
MINSCNLKKEVNNVDCLLLNAQNLGITLGFKNQHPDCKTPQILECKKQIEKKIKDSCFSKLSLDYWDSNLCDYIDDRDEYWYCKAVTKYGKGACSNIEDIEKLEWCLKVSEVAEIEGLII